MAETEAVATPAATPGKVAKPKKPKTTPNHPKVAEIVNTAIPTQMERNYPPKVPTTAPPR